MSNEYPDPIVLKQIDKEKYKKAWKLAMNNELKQSEENNYYDRHSKIQEYEPDQQSIDKTMKNINRQVYDEQMLNESLPRLKHKNQIAPVDLSEKHNRLDKLRQHTFFCRCENLNKKLRPSSFCKFLVNSFCAYPLYYSTLAMLLTFGLLGVLGYFSYLLIYTKTNNNLYFAKCGSSKDCNTIVGLGCSAENGLCNCPATYIKGRCDCTLGTYWNGTACSQWLSYQQKGCAKDFNCDQSKELKCVNQTCQCVPPKYWNTTSNMCDFNFLGCFNDNTAGSSTIMSSQNVYRKMFYFIDMCINFCRNLNYNLTLVWLGGGNSNGCLCAFTYVSSTPVSCDISCLTKNTKSYWCGNSNGNNNFRAIYVN